MNSPNVVPVIINLNTEVVVLGSGPGGYTAAFRAADLGKKVILVERENTMGGVCLNMGCIPTKTLLHAAKVITEAEAITPHGISFGEMKVDLEKLREWKSEGVIAKLTNGLDSMAVQRDVTIIQGQGSFISEHELEVSMEDGSRTIIYFNFAIISVGSSAIKIPDLEDDARIMDSTDALQLHDIPNRMLVIGGGIIGMELGTVYDALGSKISLVQRPDVLMTDCDRDLIRPLQKRMEKRFEKIMLGTKVVKIEPKLDGIHVEFEGENAIEPQVYDRVLVAIGRRPNGNCIGAENAGILVDEFGFIKVDELMRTNIPHILAVGDVVGHPMLAHKASHEGKIAAETIAGCNIEAQVLTIPSVAYTDPEVAWAGLTEHEARAKGIEIEKVTFPWAASGRALSIGRTEGLTKLIFDGKTHQLLGAGIVGTNAGELIAEAVLAIETGTSADKLGLTIHAHPTLSETVSFAAEMKTGTITDLYMRKKSPEVRV